MKEFIGLRDEKIERNSESEYMSSAILKGQDIDRRKTSRWEKRLNIVITEHESSYT